MGEQEEEEEEEEKAERQYSDRVPKPKHLSSDPTPQSQQELVLRAGAGRFIVNGEDIGTIINSTGTVIGSTISNLDALKEKITTIYVDDSHMGLRVRPDESLAKSLTPINDELDSIKSQLEPLKDKYKHIEDFIGNNVVMLTNSIEFTGRLKSIESQ